jgi:hypothetical protein
MIFLRSLVTRHDWEDDFYVEDDDTLDSSPYCGPLPDVVTANLRRPKVFLHHTGMISRGFSTTTGPARREYGGSREA